MESKTPMTDKEESRIMSDLDMMRIDGWHEAYNRMLDHARSLEVAISNATGEAEEKQGEHK